MEQVEVRDMRLDKVTLLSKGRSISLPRFGLVTMGVSPAILSIKGLIRPIDLDDLPIYKMGLLFRLKRFSVSTLGPLIGVVGVYDLAFQKVLLGLQKNAFVRNCKVLARIPAAFVLSITVPIRAVTFRLHHSTSRVVEKPSELLYVEALCV